MSILLSDKKINQLFSQSREEQHHNNLAGRNGRFEYLLTKASTIHTVQYLSGACPHGIGDFRASDRVVTMSQRFNCPDCMAEIHKELGI